MKFINDDGSVYNAKPKFIEQLEIKDMDRQYNAGVVCEKDGNYIAITSNGSLMIKEGLHRLHKTGKHYDQIAEVLAEMRGEE